MVKPLPSQAHRDKVVQTVLGADVLLFSHLHVTEKLGQLFEFRVEMNSQRADIQIAEVLGTSLTVKITSEVGYERFFNGIVTHFHYRGRRKGFPYYEAIVRPALWLLTRSTNCRIFQKMTALDIVKQVCAADVYGGLISIDESKIARQPAERLYCVQYRESDYDFACRLLEEEGIYFYFTHAEDEHTLVLADSQGSHSEALGCASLKFMDDPRGDGLLDEEHITSWSPSGEIQASEYATTDYDYEATSASLSGALATKVSIPAAFEQKAFKQYDYPGMYKQNKVGTALARARMELLSGQGEQISGETTAAGVACGTLLTMSEHPREQENREVLVTGTESYAEGINFLSGEGDALFTTRFTAIGTTHAYRAPRTTRKPVISGPQTATVVGEGTHEIYTDSYGRIKVKFHWDRGTKGANGEVTVEDEDRSCWVRVAQAWSGKNWGAMFLPRVGMEVVVVFLEGDPDQPLVTGCVYNSDNQPPYPLPDEKTKSTIKTHSTEKTGGYNEIRFEDLAGKEEVYVQAERDFNRVVKNNDTLKVGFEVASKGDQTVEIKNNQSFDIGNDQAYKTGNDQTFTIGNDQTFTISNDQKVTAGNTIVIEASTSIELKVGSSSIKIEGESITIKSTEIKVDAQANIAATAGMSMKLTSNASTDVKTSGMMTVQGSLVKIN